MLILVVALLASRDDLATQLGGFDNKITPAVLARVSEDPAADLIEIAEDEAQPLHIRRRAVSLLGRFIETRSERALERMSKHDDPILQARAQKGLRYIRKAR